MTAADVQAQVAKLQERRARTSSRSSRRRSSRSRRYVFANRLGWKPKLTIDNAVSSASNIMRLASEGGTNKVVERRRSRSSSSRIRRIPKWENDAGDEALPPDHEAYAPGANAERRLPRLRHGGGMDGGRGAEEGGQEPHARGAGQGRREHELLEQPVPAPGHRAQDRAGRPLPDRADAAPALAEGRLEELRRVLGLPRRPSADALGRLERLELRRAASDAGHELARREARRGASALRAASSTAVPSRSTRTS